MLDVPFIGVVFDFADVAKKASLGEKALPQLQKVWPTHCCPVISTNIFCSRRLHLSHSWNLLISPYRKHSFVQSLQVADKQQLVQNWLSYTTGLGVKTQASFF